MRADVATAVPKFPPSIVAIKIPQAESRSPTLSGHLWVGDWQSRIAKRAVEDASVTPAQPHSLTDDRDRAWGCSYHSIFACIWAAASTMLSAMCSLGSLQNGPIGLGGQTVLRYSFFFEVFLLNCWIWDRGFLLA